MVNKQYSMGIRPIFALKDANTIITNNNTRVNRNAFSGASMGNAMVSNKPEMTNKLNSVVKKILFNARLYFPAELNNLLLILNIGF